MYSRDKGLSELLVFNPDIFFNFKIQRPIQILHFFNECFPLLSVYSLALEFLNQFKRLFADVFEFGFSLQVIGSIFVMNNGRLAIDNELPELIAFEKLTLNKQGELHVVHHDVVILQHHLG